MISFVRNCYRLYATGRVLARHDALFLLEKFNFTPKFLGIHLLGVVRSLYGRKAEGRPGQRLARALEELGPTYIKVGQALSTRVDLLGEEITDDLSHLQDSLPAFDFADVRHTLETEFGCPLEDMFASIAEEPVAAASIAQVHKAITKEADGTPGRTVAVKVLRPGVDVKMERDLQLAFWLAKWVERVQPAMRRLKPVESIVTFQEAVRLEMDLRFEAAAAAEMADNMRDDADVVIPEVDWQRTSQRVLTTAWIDGIPIDETDRILASGHDPLVLVNTAARVFFNMVFRDGFFHGDMHPGNLFMTHDGKLAAVDFGITGRVDLETRRFLGQMLLGFLQGDYRRVAEVHFEAGFVPDHKSVDHFTQACRSIGEPIMGRELSQISMARLLGQLFQVTEQFDMHTQPQLLLLQKSMLLAEGVGRMLAPNVNMWEMARPLIEAWMTLHLGPMGVARQVGGDLKASLHKLPGLINRLDTAASAMEERGLKLHPDTLAALQGGRRSFGRKDPKQGIMQLLPWVLVAILVVALLQK